jgi:hypothetical protein
LTVFFLEVSQNVQCGKASGVGFEPFGREKKFTPGKKKAARFESVWAGKKIKKMSLG